MGKLPMVKPLVPVLILIYVASFVAPPFFNPETDSNYHYVPTGWVCLVFISLFGVSTCESMAPTFSADLFRC